MGTNCSRCSLMRRKSFGISSHNDNFDKNAKSIELVFIWDGIFPEQTYIGKTHIGKKKEKISILDNIKHWCKFYPDFSVKLWIGPNMNKANKDQMRTWSQKLTNLELKYIPKGLDEMADYESMGPFPNYAAASDRWRIHICAMKKTPETIRIYMDTDNQPEKHDTFISEITEKADKKGVVFYRSVNGDQMSFSLPAGNSIFVVSDIKKFEYFVKRIKKRAPWMFTDRELYRCYNNAHDLDDKIRYLHAGNYEIFSNPTLEQGPIRMTVKSSGPDWFNLCVLNFIKHEEDLSYLGIIDSIYNTYKITFHDKGEEMFCKEYFIDKGVKVNTSNTWLGRNTFALPTKRYASLEELKEDIVYRIFIEIKNFNDFNLPYSLLLASRYKHLFNEVTLDVFADDICKGVLNLFRVKKIATNRGKLLTKKTQWLNSLIRKSERNSDILYEEHNPSLRTDDIENIKSIAENKKIDKIIEKTSKYFEVKPISTQSTILPYKKHSRQLGNKSGNISPLREQALQKNPEDNDEQGCCCVM